MKIHDIHDIHDINSLENHVSQSLVLLSCLGHSLMLLPDINFLITHVHMGWFVRINDIACYDRSW